MVPKYEIDTDAIYANRGTIVIAYEPDKSKPIDESVDDAWMWFSGRLFDALEKDFKRIYSNE
jgi:hypothetical protein